MATEVTIYHNPRCSKSRETLALLEGKHISPKVVLYLESPPNTSTLTDILKKLGMKPRDLMRKKESAYKELGLDDPKLSTAQLITAMVEHPVLIERPIVLADGKAALGRPPEDILRIL